MWDEKRGRSSLFGQDCWTLDPEIWTGEHTLPGQKAVGYQMLTSFRYKVSHVIQLAYLGSSFYCTLPWYVLQLNPGRLSLEACQQTPFTEAFLRSKVDQHSPSSRLDGAHSVFRFFASALEVLA